MKNKLFLLTTVCCFSVLASCNGKTEDEYDHIVASTLKETYNVGTSITYGEFNVFGVKKDESQTPITDFKVSEFSDTYTFTTNDSPSKTFNITYNNHTTTCTVAVGIVPVDDVKIKEKYVILDDAQGYKEIQLHAQILPEDASNKELEWKSSNPNVATVDENGKVTIAKDRTYDACTITATSKDNKSKKAEIYALNVSGFKPVESVSVSPSSIEVEIQKESKELTATILPADATFTNVYWTSDNEEIATVDKYTGIVTAVSAGETTINAVSLDGYASGTCKVTVPEVPIESIELSSSELKFMVYGNSQKLEVTYKPTYATDKSITWTSDNENVATVDKDGNVTPVNVGNAVITATTKNGITKTCNVTVSDYIVPVTDITCVSELKFLESEEEISKTIAVTIVPEDASDKRVEFTSLDSSVATVDKLTGLVTAVQPGGETKIVVQSLGNPDIKKYVDIKIDANKPLPLKSLHLDKDGALLFKNTEEKIDIIRNPKTSKDELKVDVIGRDAQYIDASINENQLILKQKEAQSNLSVVVKISSVKDSKIQASCSILYINKSYFEFTNTDRNIKKGDSIDLTFSEYGGKSLNPTIESLNEDICTISGNKLTAVGYGSCTVKATIDGYLDAYAVFDVSDFDKVKIIYNNTVAKADDAELSNVELHLPNYYWNSSDEILYPINKIQENGFAKTGVKKVYFGENILDVGEGAFYNCGNLVSVTTNEIVETLGDGSFAKCLALKELYINSSEIAALTNNQSDIFDDLSFVKLSVEAAKGMSEKSYIYKAGYAGLYSDHAVFYQKDGQGIVRNVTFSEVTGGLKLDNPKGDYPSVTHIPSYVKYLDGSILPVVETAEFTNENIEDLRYPSTVKKIGRFWKSKTLKKADISDCVNLDNNATVDDQFSHNDNLEKVYLPQNLKTLGDWSFKADKNLVFDDNDIKSQLPDSIEEIGKECFYECHKITHVNFPTNLKTLGVRSFYNIDGLTGTLEFNDKLQTIDKAAFRYCENITGIILPNSITNLNEWCFYGCRQLTDVTYKGKKDDFKKIKKDCPFQETNVHKIHCTDGDLDW